MIRPVKEPLLRLLGQKTYVPSNVPELLRLLRLPPDRQQDLQRTLREMEQTGGIARIKGNRYVLPVEADLVPGRIRMNRAGKGFLIPDDSSLKEIAVPESATGTAMHEDRVLVRRDVSSRPPRPGEEKNTASRSRINDDCNPIVFSELVRQHRQRFLDKRQSVGFVHRSGDVDQEDYVRIDSFLRIELFGLKTNSN